MGQAKEVLFETQSLGRDWEQLVSRILDQVGVGSAGPLKPDEEPSDEDEWEMFRLVPDIAFTPVGDKHPKAVEIKMLRWGSEWHRRLRDALTHMKDILETGKYQSGVIVVTIELPADAFARFNPPLDPRIGIWDLAVLRTLAAADDDLAEQLEDLVADTIVDRDLHQPARLERDLPKGLSYARTLRQIPPGHEGWAAFEQTCEAAVRYMFSDAIANLTPQQRSEDGLNRMDLIGRIRTGGSSFWSMIASDFSTRYIVFDAKNHAGPIGQSDIQITEKYLIERGLRRVAIIFARSGASPSAYHAAAATLREHGKFILVLSLEDLCAMLEGTDAGDPPENILFARMDDMLMKMAR